MRIMPFSEVPFSLCKTSVKITRSHEHDSGQENRVWASDTPERASTEDSNKSKEKPNDLPIPHAVTVTRLKEHSHFVFVM